MRTNYLLADFSFVDINTLSHLLNTYILMPYIHNSIVFDVIFEKRCIRFLWTCSIVTTIYVELILNIFWHNKNTTLGENVRYFMQE